MSKKKQNRIKAYDKLIKKYIRRRNTVKINRTFVEGEAGIYAIILNLSKGFLLIQRNEDFDLDGYSIIRKDQFDSIRHNKFDKATNRILIQEGVIKRSYGLNFKVPLKSWKSIFRALKDKNPYIIVECENIKKPSFTIGPIKKVSKKTLHIRNFDATGKLDKKITKIRFEDITLVNFKDRYTETFKKYLKNLES